MTTPNTLTKSQAIALAARGKERGGALRLAEILGISHQAVYKWPEEIPELQLYRLRTLRPGWFRRRRSPKVGA